MFGDDELARRSVISFGEIVAALGLGAVGPGCVVRRPDAVGARIEAVGAHPWFNAAVVPFDAEPPEDDPSLPYCLWSVADHVPGRTPRPGIEMPCLGLALNDIDAVTSGEATAAPLDVVGAMNDRSYGQEGVFGPLATALRDERVRTWGLRDGGAFVCVAMTLVLGDDLGIHYVATEASHRRRGLAGRLIREMLAWGRKSGLRSATLQASPDGLRLYQGLGFRRVTTVRAFVRT